ncbi:MAG: hypothetical protein IJ019_05605 [Alphaproteobacteria bacterium]|nr:hypothetical protein [Alphaproteobacteria bacterium]
MKQKRIKKSKNYPDFHILGIDDDTIIDLQNGGLDDIESFNCSMYNFGDMDDLPDSDKQMISSDKICKEYKNN